MRSPHYDIFQSREWKKTKAAYLETHELCEICRREKQLIIAEDVYITTGITGQMLRHGIDPECMIAVCKRHLAKLIRKSRRYFDEAGHLLIDRGDQA
jgi:hypothetical protein